MGKLLALDYGSKRTGVAETDDLQLIASGLKTVETSNLMEFLKEFQQEHQVDAIIIGQPRQRDGSPSDIEIEILKFIEKLEQEIPDCTVVRMDERFTSKMAFQSMIDGGLSKKQRRNKGLVDEISATILLQDYLQYKNN